MSERTTRTRRPSGPPSPAPALGGRPGRVPAKRAGKGEGCAAGGDRPGHVTVTNRQRRLPVDTAWLGRELTRVVAEENLGRSPLSVVLVSDRSIRRLNRDFHGRTEVTDVLTFDYGPAVAEDDVAAEVVVSAERALAEALSRGLPPDGELLLYCIHGFLHLAGYEDTTPAGGERMWRRQFAHLKRAGFPARRWKDGPRHAARSGSAAGPGARPGESGRGTGARCRR